jgi:hypothetical protein
LAVLVGLRDGLRSGDVFVPGSQRYADPASFLLTPEAWAPQKVEFCHLVGKPGEVADALRAELAGMLPRYGWPRPPRQTADRQSP